MKKGIRIGQTWAFDVTVTEPMRAHFGDITVHHVYGTPAMLQHMEWAARQHILPYLEEGEEGVGYHMQIAHMNPAPIGATITVSSRVTGIKPNKVITQCHAHHNNQLIGKAKVVQAILPLTTFHEKIAHN